MCVEIVEDMGLPERIHALEAVHDGDSCVFIHIHQKILFVREAIQRMPADEVGELIAEEMLFLIGAKNAKAISSEQFQSLQFLLTSPRS